MTKVVKGARFLLRRSDNSGVTPTEPISGNDHTQWINKDTDIYVGELFFNSEDNKLWVRTKNSIEQIPVFEGDDLRIPNGDIIFGESSGYITYDKVEKDIKFKDSSNGNLFSLTKTRKIELDVESNGNWRQRYEGDTSWEQITTRDSVTGVQNLPGEINNLKSSVSSEISNRISDKDSLSSRIDDESNDRISDKESLSTVISLETNARVSDKESLSTVISSESVTRIGQVNNLNQSISSEITNRSIAVSNLNTSLSSEITNRSIAVSNLSSNISVESSNRISERNSLSSVISSESTTRIGQVNSLNQSISSETSNRISERTSLSSIISTETNNRSIAVSNLSSSISVESSTRIGQVSNLSSNLSSEINARSTAVSNLSSNLSSEINARSTAINNLSSSILTDVNTTITSVEKTIIFSCTVMTPIDKIIYRRGQGWSNINNGSYGDVFKVKSNRSISSISILEKPGLLRSTSTPPSYTIPTNGYTVDSNNIINFNLDTCFISPLDETVGINGFPNGEANAQDSLKVVDMVITDNDSNEFILEITFVHSLQ